MKPTDMDQETWVMIPLADRIFWDLEQNPSKADLAVLKLFVDKFPSYAYAILDERMDKENYALAISFSQRFIDEDEK